MDTTFVMMGGMLALVAHWHHDQHGVCGGCQGKRLAPSLDLRPMLAELICTSRGWRCRTKVRRLARDGLMG